MRSLANEFRAFILRGNVIDLAVAVVVGAAFGAVVTAAVTDIIMPIIGIFGGKPTFDQYYWSINHSEIKVGSFLTAMVAFLIIATAVFVLIVKPMNMLASLRKTGTPVAETTRECPYCLSKIPMKASRCAFCTQEVAPEEAPTLIEIPAQLRPGNRPR